MYAVVEPDFDEIEYVLDNLSDLTVEELIFAFGYEWKKEIKTLLKFVKELYVIRLKKDDSAVGLFGIDEISQKSAGIYLLLSEEIKKGNMIHLIRESKKVVEKWLEEYDELLDDCHYENEKIIRWLMLLGFKPTDEIKSGGFITFRKTKQ